MSEKTKKWCKWFVVLFNIYLIAEITVIAQDSILNEAQFSVRMNLVPKQMNQDVSDIPGSENLNSDAYLYQGAIVLPTEASLKLPLFKAQYSYGEAFLMRSLTRYEDKCEGASEIEGYGGLYGSRYMLTNESYEGFGLGWHAGMGLFSSKWVECNGRYSGQEAIVMFMAAAEIFYKWNFANGLLLEPAILLAIDKNTNQATPVPQVNLGFEF